MRLLLDTHVWLWLLGDVDRLLIAQARVEGLTLVTNDAQIQDYDEPMLAV